MELIKSIIAIYSVIPDVFWNHFYSFIGSLLSVMFHISYDNTPPLTTIQILTNLLGGYVFGYLFGIPMIRVELVLADAFLKEGFNQAITANASHFLIAFLGASILKRFRNQTKDQENNPPNTN